MKVDFLTPARAELYEAVVFYNIQTSPLAVNLFPHLSGGGWR